MNKAIVKKPWITERAADQSRGGKYIFLISRDQNKTEAVKAIEAIYNVEVEKANVLNVRGKAKRLGRTQGRRSDYKKVVVTLKKGQTIDVIPS